MLLALGHLRLRRSAEGFALVVDRAPETVDRAADPDEIWVR